MLPNSDGTSNSSTYSNVVLFNDGITVEDKSKRKRVSVFSRRASAISTAAIIRQTLKGKKSARSKGSQERNPNVSISSVLENAMRSRESAQSSLALDSPMEMPFR